MRFAGSPSGVPAWFVALDARTAIERTETEFTFIVRELEYRIEAGIGGLALPGGNATISALRWGRENVDAPGQPRVDAVLLGFESAGFSSDGADPGWGWRLRAGPAIDDREVEADVAALASVRWVGPELFGPWRLGIDADVAALVEGSDVDEDLEIGVRLLAPLRGDRAFSLFVRGLRGRNPLGARVEAAWVGFSYAEGPGPSSATADGAPDVSGRFDAGTGDGRRAGRLALVFRSPRVGRWHAAVSVDANVLTADETGDLYYLYDVGAVRDLAAWRAGAWFYHRSNHVLAEANDTVTSLNVFEVGVETRPDARPAWLARGVDLRARVGWLASSRFGEDRRWHARAAARWTAPSRVAGWAPFVEAEYEAGDVRRRVVAVGGRRPSGIEVRLEHRDDHQWFARDRTALLALLGVAF